MVMYIPKEVIKQCGFEHKDKFNIKITDNSISIAYEIGAPYMLAKSGKDLVFNLNGKEFSKTVLDSLRHKESRTITCDIIDNKLVADLSKLAVKKKGFNLFQAPNKGFDKMEKKHA